jgi:selenocysteine-specific elongation factor
MKRTVVIGTAGHIDHGKSALVRALTGTDPDRLKEEQERGITIDLGFAHLETDTCDLSFVDVPGHERFVKNMLAGAGGVDLVLLVVAADESVMPQTREHFEICELLRVPCGVIVLTKTDIADPDMQEIAALETRELVEGSFLAAAPLVRVSAKTGQGLDELRATLQTLAGRVRERSSTGPVRLPVDRVFTMKGFGTVVTGTLVSGSIAEEQELLLLPSNRRVKVRGLQVHGRRESNASAGRRVAANLGGIEVSDLERGETLTEPGAFENASRLDAALDLLPDARVLKHGTRVRFHHGTSELIGRVSLSSGRDGEAALAALQPGQSAFARLRLEAPAVLTRGDRFIIRAYSPPVTIGGGVVLDPNPPRSAIRTAAGIARMRALGGDTNAVVTAMVRERSASGLSRSALVSRAGLAKAEAAALVERLAQERAVEPIDDLIVSTEALTACGERLISELKAHHRANPLSEGMPREEARERIFGRAPPAVFAHVIQRLMSAGRIAGRDRLALQGHQVSLSPEESRVQTLLTEIFREAKLAPPDVQAAAAAAGTPRETADRVIGLLLRQRILVRLDTLVFHAASLETLKADVRKLKEVQEKPRVDVASFKERYGITRKYAIPLLEYLDRERVTRRVGDARVVL